MPPHVNLARLSPVHVNAALLYAQGYTQVQIAEQLELSQAAVGYWWKSPLFVEKVQEFQREIFAESIQYARNKIGVLQAKAVDRLEHLMEHAHSEAVQLGATREILERGPLRIQRGPGDQKISTGTVILSKDMLIAMAQVAEMTGDQSLLDTMHALPLMQEPVLDAPETEATEDASPGLEQMPSEENADAPAL